MKIAVLSDIHSNHIALKECVDYALKNNIKHFLFLGDYVSDCAYPQKTMKLLYEMEKQFKCWFIKGNREEYLLKHCEVIKDGWKIPSSATGSLLYTYQELSEQDFSFFNQMAISGVMSIEGYPEFLYCHGSMDNTRGDLRFGSQKAEEMLENMKTDMILCGHTHKQGIYEKNGKKIVNVGSVGVPWDYEGDAQFGILSWDFNQWNIELIHLKYNKEQAVKELYESGLTQKANVWPKLVEETLLTGIDQSQKCLQIVLEKCEKAEGNVSWEEVSEKYWEEAGREMGYII